jgi:hypothetical protein
MDMAKDIGIETEILVRFVMSVEYEGDFAHRAALESYLDKHDLSREFASMCLLEEFNKKVDVFSFDLFSHSRFGNEVTLETIRDYITYYDTH